MITIQDAYTAKATHTVPLEEYTKFRNRIIDQLRATIALPGFRPGKVPAKMADEELDPTKVESIVQQETIQKFGNSIIIDFVAELKAQGKQGIGFDVTVNGEGLGLTDNGFVFELTATTLPDIKIFGDETAFDETYTKTWESEKVQVKKNIKQTRVIQALLDLVPEFELQEAVVDSEIERITKSVLEDVKENGKTIAEIVEIIGMPNPKKIVAKTEKELKEIVTNYVKNEMRLMWILRKVYEDFVVTKPTQEDIDNLAKDMETKSDQYNVPKNLPTEQYQDMAFDRAMRGTAYDIINGWVVA